MLCMDEESWTKSEIKLGLVIDLQASEPSAVP